MNSSVVRWGVFNERDNIRWPVNHSERRLNLMDDCFSNLSAMETAGLLQKLSALEENLKMERNRAVQAEVGYVC